MPEDKQRDVELPLLANGLDFIKSALEHLSGTATSRDLKYTVLHLCSGIELVLKERLQKEHWSLVFDDPDNAGKSAFETGDFTSVSFKACLKRLTDICGVQISDKQRRELLGFRNKRNRLEHFGIVDSSEAITAAAVRALVFVMDFMNHELEPEQLREEDAETLDSIRQMLGECEAFVEQRWNTIKKELESVGTAVVTCPRCTQEAVVIDDGASCRFCGYERSAGDAAEDYIADVLGMDSYRTIKHGGEWPLYTCPECGLETLVDCGPSESEEPRRRYICFACGEIWKDGTLDHCSTCGELYDPGESGDVVCYACFQAMVGKD